MKKKKIELRHEIKEIDRTDRAVRQLCDSLLPSNNLAVDISQTSLPYHSLGGRGFERLILNLLIAEGKKARFFGDRGQRDYEVDILVGDGDALTLYQCKNYAKKPTLSDITKTLNKFNKEWLEERNLPKPKKYVYCCPHPFSDLKKAEEWTQKEEEYRKNGIQIEMLTSIILDEKLKKLPDVVADVFSDAYAKIFCGEKAWPTDPWIRITSEVNEQRDRQTRRFLELRNAQKIYVDEDLQDWFTPRISSEKILLLRGLPGSGKTTTVFAMATALQQPERHVYYSSAKSGINIEIMTAAVRRRHNLPSVFILDDCHGTFAQIAQLLDRLTPELNNPHDHIRFILLARHTPVKDEQESLEENFFIDELKEHDRIYTFTSSPGNLKKIIEYLRPDDLKGLSEDRLSKCYGYTGGDLLLLDCMLQYVADPEDIDSFDPTTLWKNIYEQYFGNRQPSFTHIQDICCLAQFDLDLLVEFFGPVEGAEKTSLRTLAAIIPSPDRYRLLHSTLAELLYRALCYRRYGQVKQECIRDTVSACKKYFKWMMQGEEYREKQLVFDIKNFLYSTLHMISGPDQDEIKISILTDQQFLKWIECNLSDFTFHTLKHCADILAKSSNSDLTTYVEFILKKFNSIVSAEVQEIENVDVATMSFGLSALAAHAPQEMEKSLSRLHPITLLNIFQSRGSLVELFFFISFAPEFFSRQLIEALDQEKAAQLLQATINNNRSIGTLHMAMWKIGERDKEMLIQLEDLIEPTAFLNLIARNGTLFELFNILKDSTPNFADKLLKALDRAGVQELINRTISSGRSIGTLHIAMWKIGERDKKMLTQLEDLIDPTAFLNLIARNGTLFELFRILECSSPIFADKLLKALDPAGVHELINRTINNGRSIGTLHMAMWKISERDKKMLTQLEKLFDPTAFLNLITRNGTLFELFRTLEYSSPNFAGKLLKALDPAGVHELINRTINSGRSIGTLDMAMWKIGERDKKMLTQLEDLIDPTAFLHLIASNGTLIELFRTLQHSTPNFTGKLLDALDSAGVDELINRTIADGRAINSLHYQTYMVEKILKPDQLWHLIINVGSLSTLTAFHARLTSAYLASLSAIIIDCTQEQWRRILGREELRFIYTFIRETLNDYPEKAKRSFLQALEETIETLVTQSSWLGLQVDSRPGNDDPALALIDQAVRHRLATISIAEIHGLSFIEAINSISILWRNRPDLHKELAKQFLEILPAPEKWPINSHEIAALRLVLHCATSPIISRENVDFLINEARGPWPAKTYQKINTLPSFLLLWNLAVLWYARCRGQSLRALLPEKTKTLLCAIVIKRLGENLDDEKLIELYSLVGLLGYISPDTQGKLRDYVPTIQHKKYLRDNVLNLPFPHAFFALLGMSLNHSLKSNYSPERCRHLIKKAHEYDTPTPLVDKIARDLEKMN